MPIELAIWKIDDKLRPVPFSSLESESRLEDLLDVDISTVFPNRLLIGRQVATDHGKFIDLLVMNGEGDLEIIELKRDRTPRQVVAQVLDYASWIEGLSYDDVSAIYAEKNGGEQFEEGFAEAFGASPPETVNEAHSLTIVCSELDPSSERIIDYLSDGYGVPINAVFLRYFRDGEEEYITRTWLIDPREVEAGAAKKAKKKQETWNGRDFYVSLGEGGTRNWDDCRRYGFICGGGGRWYMQTLDLLAPGHRVFVNLPGTGFVGVGEVVGESTPVAEFEVEVDGEKIPILEAPLRAPEMGKFADDPEKSQYLVEVEWIEAVDRSEAYWEKGLFASQHTACRLRNQFTIERLTRHFGIDE